MAIRSSAGGVRGGVRGSVRGGVRGSVRGGVLLRDRNFRTLWAGTTVAQFGSSVGALAIQLLAVGALHATPLQMGVLAAAQTVGFLLIGLPAGAWVDRSRRLPLMLAMDLVRCGLLLTVPLCWWLGVLGMPQLVATAFAVGIATVFFEVAYGSYLPSLVGKDHLMEGNAKLQASQSFAGMAGPSLGGVLAGLAGAANAVLCTAAGFAVSAVQLWRIRAAEPRPARAPRRDLAAEIGEGVRFVFGDTTLRAIACCTAMTNLFMSMAAALTVLFLNRVVGLSPAATGLVLVSLGVGGAAGVLTARRIAGRLGQGRTIWASMAATRPFGLLLPLTQPGWAVGFFVAGWFLIGYGNVVYNVAQVTLRQSLCPDHLLGRMNASNRVLAWGTLPVGGALGGVLGESLGVRSALWIVAAGLILSVAWLLASPLRAARDAPAAVPGD